MRDRSPVCQRGKRRRYGELNSSGERLDVTMLIISIADFMPGAGTGPQSPIGIFLSYAVQRPERHDPRVLVVASLRRHLMHEAPVMVDYW